MKVVDKRRSAAANGGVIDRGIWIYPNMPEDAVEAAWVDWNMGMFFRVEFDQGKPTVSNSSALMNTTVEEWARFVAGASLALSIALNPPPLE